MTPKVLASTISAWYLENKRDLPWRKDRDPYRIWISEIMLQQTTVTAVIPYYERFLKEFPQLKNLAKADLGEVLKLWTGLGYYSRARNLHKAALQLGKTGWPQSYLELLEVPGFGPYTARAVSSFAFDESVGVLDGNVIRVLSRVSGQAVEHWTNKGRTQLQLVADQIAQAGSAAVVNQALMELGATLCTPRRPQCLMCPWFKGCEGRKLGLTEKLPLKKPRKEIQTWIWQPTIFRRGDKVALVENSYAPFLKKQWIFPGRAEFKAQKPKEFDLRHGITHHDIYVQVVNQTSGQATAEPGLKGMKWVSIDDLTNWNPSILLKKTLAVSSPSASLTTPKKSKRFTKNQSL